MSGDSRRLYAPRRVEVRAGPGATPRAVGGVGVEAVREEWRLEDRWWTRRPLHRRYFEIVLADGRDVVVFREAGGGWYLQRA
jgi:hypothetical protein